jgi:hypothetical protein
MLLIIFRLFIKKIITIIILILKDNFQLVAEKEKREKKVAHQLLLECFSFIFIELWP